VPAVRAAFVLRTTTSLCPPEQPNDDGAEELLRGTSGLVPCASAWTPRTRAERSWGSSRRRRDSSQGLPRPRRSSLSIPARAPWTAAFLAAQLHAGLIPTPPPRPNRPRARYLSRYPISTLQTVIAFAGWCNTDRGSTRSRTARVSSAPLSLGRRTSSSRRAPFRDYGLSRST
jgi:hypothetical protein